MVKVIIETENEITYFRKQFATMDEAQDFAIQKAHNLGKENEKVTAIKFEETK